jgi:hypothetical protein
MGKDVQEKCVHQFFNSNDGIRYGFIFVGFMLLNVV